MDLANRSFVASMCHDGAQWWHMIVLTLQSGYSRRCILVQSMPNCGCIFDMSIAIQLVRCKCYDACVRDTIASDIFSVLECVQEVLSVMACARCLSL